MSSGSGSTIEHQPSKTAMGVALLRAVAALDEREEIRGQDNLAEIFLIEQWRGALKGPTMRESIVKRVLFPGAYEYILARTAFIDSIMEQALREDIPQIVFLGAGYDSRAYRFKNLIKQTTIFEVDAPATQQSKRELLHKANIGVPEQVVFVPVNFNSESLKTALFDGGFAAGQRTLFIWEGVTMYLSADVVDDTLRFIKSESSEGSLVCFDYGSHWPEMLDAYGVKELREFHEANAPGEPLQFGIERDKIESFLSERGYEIVDHLTATDIEKRFLTFRDGSTAGRIPALICFALASVKA
jgi:methyltransferase (TIGR00027 family)